MAFGGAHICNYAESPTFLQGNQYILTGYRCDFTKMQCLRSVFMLTNETLNIWTHLLGVFWFLYNIYDVNMKVLPGYKTTTVLDHIIMTSFCISCLSCCLFSVLYHIFSCHSKHYNEAWYKLDLIGITSVMFGSYITALYYGFYCFKTLRTCYVLFLVLLLVLNLYFQVYRPKTHKPGIDVKNVFFFAFVIFFGVLPAAHWVYISGGFENDMVQMFVPRILIVYVICGVAVFFYLTKTPERCLPGRFDYIGSSHQIWHLFILSALLWWYQSCLLLNDWRLGGRAACPIVQSS